MGNQAKKDFLAGYNSFFTGKKLPDKNTDFRAGWLKAKAQETALYRTEMAKLKARTWVIG